MVIRIPWWAIGIASTLTFFTISLLATDNGAVWFGMFGSFMLAMMASHEGTREQTLKEVRNRERKVQRG